MEKGIAKKKPMRAGGKRSRGTRQKEQMIVVDPDQIVLPASGSGVGERSFDGAVFIEVADEQRACGRSSVK